MIYMYDIYLIHVLPGPIVQSVVNPTADPGIVSSIPAGSHTFVEFDIEIISTAILLLPLI